MKKLLLTGLAFTSFIALNAQANPTIKDETLYTTEKGYTGDLTPLVSGGTPPYMFPNASASTYKVTNGMLDLNSDGTFNLAIFNDNEPATFKVRVNDAQGFISDEATITVERVESLPSKAKLD